MKNTNALIVNFTNVVHKILLILFVSFIACTSSSSQKNKDSKPELQKKAERFIANVNQIMNDENPERIKSEILVTKPELRMFLEKEWKRKYNLIARKAMKDDFEPSVDKGWKHICRDGGYYLANSLVKEMDLVSRTKIINPTLKNAKFSEIDFTISDTYDGNIGEISMLELILVTCKVVTDSNPISTYKFTFPCVLTESGHLKMIGSLNGILISMNPK